MYINVLKNILILTIIFSCITKIFSLYLFYEGTNKSRRRSNGVLMEA